MRRLRIGMAQVNTTVGDFAGNTQKILVSLPLSITRYIRPTR